MILKHNWAWKVCMRRACMQQLSLHSSVLLLSSISPYARVSGTMSQDRAQSIGSWQLALSWVAFKSSCLELYTYNELCCHAGKKFNSATAFSMHCKRLQTPGKQGDDGWKSVQYEGTQLDVYRRKYLAHTRIEEPDVRPLSFFKRSEWISPTISN